MLPIVTPDAGTKVVLPEPISTKLYLYPIGIFTAEFAGTVKFIGDDVCKKIVLLTSRGSKVKADVLITTVLLFNNVGSRSNLSSTPFHSRPSPARFGYSAVAPATALMTYACDARFAVFAIPWTFVVAALCAAMAASLFTISAASASTRVFR